MNSKLPVAKNKLLHQGLKYNKGKPVIINHSAVPMTVINIYNSTAVTVTVLYLWCSARNGTDTVSVS